MSYENRKKFKKDGVVQVGVKGNGDPFELNNPKFYIGQILFRPGKSALIDVHFTEGDGIDEKVRTYEIPNEDLSNQNGEVIKLNENTGVVTFTFKATIFGENGQVFIKDFTEDV